MRASETNVLVTTLVVTGAFASLFAGALLIATLPFNPVSTHLGFGEDLKTVMPEGWAFFTRNAREADTYLFRKMEGRWQPYTEPFPNAKATNYFGLNRRSRAATTEMVILLSQIQNARWETYELPVNPSNVALVDTSKMYPTVLNPVAVPMLCGDLAIVRAKPVSWRYRRSGQHEVDAFDILFLTNSCPSP